VHKGTEQDSARNDLGPARFFEGEQMRRDLVSFLLGCASATVGLSNSQKDHSDANGEEVVVEDKAQGADVVVGDEEGVVHDCELIVVCG
jgi:hypothetical protein